MIFVFEDLLTHYSSVSQPFKGRGAHGNQIVGELVICRVKLQFLDSSFVDFKIFREHLKAACGALVVPGALVGHYFTFV